MTDHPHHDNHGNHLDPAHLDRIALDELRDAREAATDAGDLRCAVLADNALEDRDALGRVTPRRRTCRPCSDWADHVHDPLTGERMRIERWPATFTQADLASTARTAARVFALVSATAPEHWQHLDDGGYRITVELDRNSFDVVLPLGPDGRPRPAYIEDYLPSPTGDLAVPFIYANPRATTAIAIARRYITPPA